MTKPDATHAAAMVVGCFEQALEQEGVVLDRAIERQRRMYARPVGTHTQEELSAAERETEKQWARYNAAQACVTALAAYAALVD